MRPQQRALTRVKVGVRSLHQTTTPTLPRCPTVTETRPHNDRFPTDPSTVLLLALAVTGAASQLTTDQAQAVIATGGIAEFALLMLRLARGGR